MSDPLLRPGQVAKILAISVKTLRRWSQSGKLPTYFIGGHRRYKKSDIQQLVIKPDGKHPGDMSPVSATSTSK